MQYASRESTCSSVSSRLALLHVAALLTRKSIGYSCQATKAESICPIYLNYHIAQMHAAKVATASDS